ncbi:MAG: Fibronectin-attachment protein, partial [Mycobacterium sp.]|nr:Fibronectin-attachment protein [Mycobacterium sp.]
MDQPDANSTRRKGLSNRVAVAAVTGAVALTFTLPASLAYADPVPPNTTTAAP